MVGKPCKENVIMTHTLIIAEAGVNHNGDIELAKKLIDVAVKARVDYVKFQTFKAERLVTKIAKKAEYQVENTQNDESQFSMLKKLELDLETHHVLINYCKGKNIKFLSTGFDMESLDLLHDLNIDLFKVPSGEITNLPYLRKIASFKKPVILSTGMCTMLEVKAAYNVMVDNGVAKEDVTILHCNTEYPTPMIDVNLNAMLSIKTELGVEVGYSDHTLGIEVPIAAVAMGAVCIEKHFTLDREMEGPDHHASLLPEELKNMVLAIRNIEKAMGDGVKKPTTSEMGNKIVGRKSIVALKEINIGDVFSKDNLTVKRPGTGISPMLWDEYIGRVSKKDYKLEEQINLNT